MMSFFISVLPVMSDTLTDTLHALNEETPLSECMQTGNEYYEAGKYTEAIEAYKAIEQRGYFSVELYFNLGNAYFKQNSIGKAILYFERAKRLDPNDEDVNFNLEYARATTVDNIETGGSFWFKDMVHVYLKFNSVNGWAWLSLALLFFSVLTWSVFLSNRFSGPTLVLTFVVSTVLALVSLFSSFGRKSLDAQRQAVLLNEGITVKSAPSKKGEDMFIIHEGTKMELLDVYQDWLKIRLDNGNVGWLPQTSVEEI